MGGISHAHLNMTYTEHLQITQIRRNTTAIVKSGKHYRFIDGVMMTEAEFRKRYALPVRCGISKENPCNKHKFLDV